VKSNILVDARIKAGEGTSEPRLFDAMLGIALVLRLSHAQEILETQGIPQLFSYFKGIEQKAASNSPRPN
jgi:ERCC4-related helicase